MEEFAAGTDVFLTVEHMNNDTVLEVTDLQYQVLDAHGEVLVDLTTAPSFDPAATSTIVTILKNHNTTVDKIDVRQVNVVMVTAAGSYKQTFYYKLVGDVTRLTPMVDSFMTYPESVIVRAKMSDQLEYYDALTDAIRATALENTYRAILKLPFDLSKCGGPRCHNERGTDISAYSLEQFKALPAAFQLAVKQAQIVEANALVENSPIRDKIKNGIVSETIGESSMFFKQSMTFGGTKFKGISDDTYTVLSDFLFKSARNAQIWRLARA